MGGEISCLNCVIDSPAGASAWPVVISLAAAAAGVWGAWNGHKARQIAQRNRAADIRDQAIEPHKIALETLLLNLENNYNTLRASSPQAMPFARVVTNFDAKYSGTTKVAGGIIDQARKIDAKKIFTERWCDALTPTYTAIDINWDALKNAQKTESDRRLAATAIVIEIESLIEKTRALLAKNIELRLNGRA